MPKQNTSNQALFDSAPLYVKKFGGTSVGSIERIEILAEQIAQSYHAGERQVVVLSAMAGETNRLVALGGKIDPSGSAREMDMLLSTGEQISIALMAMALHKRRINAISLTGGQVKIRTNSQFGRASIEQIDTDYLLDLLEQGIVPVIAGFQGRNNLGEITTLGRGGSDTSAVALAAALKANECRIYTDVTGVFTTDPNLEPSARRLPSIGFSAMFEMARLGAKVLHPDSVAYAERFNVPLRVMSSFEPGEGTLICFDEHCDFNGDVLGIAVTRDLAMISLDEIPASSNKLIEVLQRIENLGIEADLFGRTIHENCSACFMVSSIGLERVLTELDNLSQSLNLGSINAEQELAKISLVGGMALANSNVVSKVFEVLGELAINVKLISISEIKVVIVISKNHIKPAVCALHHAFSLAEL